MRIIGGRHRGLTLADPGKGDPAAHLRPTADRVREAVFSMLTAGRFGNRVEGAHVLDLFAGTGAMGLEALSRGAVHAAFVDRGRKALSLIHENLRRAGRAGDAQVLGVDATRLPPWTGAPFDLLFLDPPHRQALGEAALASALAGGWLAPGAIIVWEEAAPVSLPPGVTLADQRRHGASVLTTLLYEPDSPATSSGNADQSSKENAPGKSSSPPRR